MVDTWGQKVVCHYCRRFLRELTPTVLTEYSQHCKTCGDISCYICHSALVAASVKPSGRLDHKIVTHLLNTDGKGLASFHSPHYARLSSIHLALELDFLSFRYRMRCGNHSRSGRG